MVQIPDMRRPFEADITSITKESEIKNICDIISFQCRVLEPGRVECMMYHAAMCTYMYTVHCGGIHSQLICM